MNYKISKKTLAVIPVDDESCRVIEGKHCYNVDTSSFNVIEHSCEYFGSSYESRLLGSRRFIKTRYKVPIIIEESARVVFFPLTSQLKSNNVWISYGNILEYYHSEINKNSTVIVFKNGFKMEIPVSFYSFNNQFLKASRLSSILADRMFQK